MTIKLRRTSQESVEINTDKLGTMLVFQQFGKHDHRITENILRKYFGSESVSIHFQLKMASIFIFEMDHDVLSKKELNDIRSRLTNRRKYAIVQQNGQIAKGKTLQMLQITNSKDRVSVLQKFAVLLTVNVNKEPVEDGNEVTTE